MKKIIIGGKIDKPTGGFPNITLLNETKANFSFTKKNNSKTETFKISDFLKK